MSDQTRELIDAFEECLDWAERQGWHSPGVDRCREVIAKARGFEPVPTIYECGGCRTRWHSDAVNEYRAHLFDTSVVPNRMVRCPGCEGVTA